MTKIIQLKNYKIYDNKLCLGNSNFFSVSTLVFTWTYNDQWEKNLFWIQCIVIIGSECNYAIHLEKLRVECWLRAHMRLVFPLCNRIDIAGEYRSWDNKPACDLFIWWCFGCCRCSNIGNTKKKNYLLHEKSPKRNVNFFTQATIKTFNAQTVNLKI